MNFLLVLYINCLIPFNSLGDDHLILKGVGGGGWHFLEINIPTLKMLEINKLSSSGKKINNLTLTCWIGEQVQIFPKMFPSLCS